MPIGNDYDCVVVGGGPAGSTLATLLADYGHRTLLLERSHFPRHHIGESLMPQTYWTLRRLGMLEALKASDFPRKESVQFISPTGEESQPFYFTDRDPNEWSVTWQVRRDRFDAMMLDNARNHGVEVRHGVRVSQVLFEGDRAVGVRALVDGVAHEIRSSVVADATGVSALLSRQLDLREPDPQLKNGAIYSYYRGVRLDEGRNAGATLVIHTHGHNGWFWVIPLPDGITSIGIVAPPSYLFTGRGDNPEATFEDEVAQCPGLCCRLQHAQRVSQIYVTSDFSYRARRVSGDGWVLVGDAFCFLDPIYSSGVFFALESGEFAADAIHEALQSGNTSAARLGPFGPRLLAGIHRVQKLVYAFYDKSFSFGQFNRMYPQYRDHIVRLLIGDVLEPDVDEVFDVLRDWVALPEPMRLDPAAPTLTPAAQA